MRSFYQRYWSADAARVAVVGALPEGLEAAIEQAFGDWKKADAPRFVRWVPASIVLPAERVDVQARDKSNAELHMAQRIAMNRDDADYLPLMLAVRVFGEGGMETRLATRVRRTDGLSYGIGADLGVPFYGRDAGLSITASFAPQNRDRILGVIREELERMGRDGISAEELERARHEVLEARRSSRSRDGALSGLLNFMAETDKRWDAEQRLDDGIAAVTLEQANAAWRKYVRADGFLTSTVGDFEGKPQAR